MTAFVICVGSSLLSITEDVTVLICKNAASIACIVFRYFNRKTIIATISKISHAIAV